MAYVPVPKDLTKVKTKVLLNLTKRQLIFFSGGVLLGVPLFFLLKGPLGVSTAAICMVVVMLPFFLLAMYEKNGQPLEVIIRNIVRVSFLRLKQRPYKTNNFYVTHSGEGEGLLFYGNVILPFIDHFPRNSELYRVMTTKVSEVRGA